MLRRRCSHLNGDRFDFNLAQVGLGNFVHDRTLFFLQDPRCTSALVLIAGHLPPGNIAVYR